MKKKSVLLLSLLALCFSCSSQEVLPLKSPMEDGGLGGNASEDVVATRSVDEVKNLLNRASRVSKYSYAIDADVTGVKESFVSYYTPNAYYEDHGAGNEQSFGYAQTKTNHYLFKYYLSEDEKEVIPSIYEYEGLSDTIEKVQGLYGAFTLAHFSLLSATMESFDAIYVGSNRFLISDVNTASIFQFMTTFGSSISNYLTGVYIEILDLNANKFKAICDLGAYGLITGTFSPENSTKIDFVNDQASRGELEGVDSYNDVQEFFDLTKQNNYVLEGIYVNSNGVETRPQYTIHCTNNYFLLDYSDPSYRSFGYVLVPENTTVTYGVAGKTTTQTLSYAACYGFSVDNQGNYFFDSFMGPVESDGIKYQEVDVLPPTGDPNILYIVPTATGEKEVYEWAADGQGVYSFKRYSSWYDCVGDFYFNNISATFYFSGTPLSEIGAHYFEKDLKEEGYYSRDSGIMSSLGNGLFGWGFQPTTTWMNYIQEAKLSVHKDAQDQVDSASVGLVVSASIDGNYSNQHIYYKVKDFGKGNVEDVETFLEEKGIGDMK